MSWSKWWWVKNRLSIWVGQSPDWTSLWVVAGPQSNMIFSPSMSATYAEPKRVGVGVGVPAPRMWREVGVDLGLGIV